GKKGPGADGDETFFQEGRFAADNFDVCKASVAIDERIEDNLAAEKRLRRVGGGDERKRNGRRRSLRLFHGVFWMVGSCGGCMPGDVLLLQQCDCVVNGENRARGVLIGGGDGECVVAEPLTFHETDYFLRIGGEYGSAALTQDDFVVEEK